MRAVTELFEQHLDTLVITSVENVLESHHSFYTKLPPEMLRRAVAAAFQAVLTDLKQGSNTSFAGYMVQSGQQRAQQGALPSDIMSGFNIGIATVNTFFKQQFSANPEPLAWWFERIYEISQAAATSLSDAMLITRDAVVQSQASVIRELSTPIMPLYQGLLVVPLVGPIDAVRAQQITETLLQSIMDHQADNIVLDITGVPGIDTNIAQYILQAAKAINLLGAKVVLVGIGAQIAQTMVELGVDFQNIATQANLQAGITYVLNSDAG